MSPRSRSRYGDGADVVLVAVGEHQRLDVVEAVPDRLEVGEDQVDARVVLLGEQHAAVDDQQPAVVLEDGHVPADLAEPAERDDPQAVLGERSGGGELGMGMAHARGFLQSPAADQLGAQVCDQRVGLRATSGRRTLRLGITPSSCSAALAIMAPWRLVHDRVDDGDQPAVDVEGRGEVTGLHGADHRGVLVAGDVADHRDDADGAEGQPGEVEHVVAGVERQAGLAA